MSPAALNELERTAYISGRCELADLAAKLADDESRLQLFDTEDETIVSVGAEAAASAAQIKLVDETIADLQDRLNKLDVLYKQAVDTVYFMRNWLKSPECLTPAGRFAFAMQIDHAIRRMPE